MKINLTIELSKDDVAVLHKHGVLNREDIIRWIRAGIVAAIVDYRSNQSEGTEP